MAYLLSQYTLLFLLTAFVAFLLGRWWVQRRYIDITESWESLRAAREADEGFRDRLWTGLEELRRSVAPTVRTELSALPTPKLPEPNLDRILTELKRLETRIEGIRPTPAADLKPVQSRLDTLDARFSALKLPGVPQLGPLEARLSRLESMLQELPERLPQQAPDFTAISDRLDALERTLQNLQALMQPSPDPALAALDTRLEALAAEVGSNSAASLQWPDRLRRLEAAINELPRLERQDLQSVHFRVAEVERLLRAGAVGSQTDAGLGERFQALERAVAGLSQQVASSSAKATGPATNARSSTANLPVTEPQLFASPSEGEPDDLKRIAGVGPKLEQLLNANGVYYFRQIASWQDSDVRFIDARLQVFRGRIERDGWVTQARDLAGTAAAESADAAETPRPDLFSDS